MRIAIIGGGIAGMAAAFELEKARAAGAEIEYALFEARERLGGSLASEVVDGAVIERGPDSFLTEKLAAAELCRELGLGSDLIPSNDAARKTYVVIRNRLVALPDGLMFLVPTKLIPTALTPLFSFSTKARMALELLHPPRPNNTDDESVAALVERHYGAEAVDRLADPLLAGIYGGDAAQLSARTVLPRLVEMESKYGSLTRGMLAAHREMRAGAHSSPGANGHARPAGQQPQRSLFTALRGGMQQLVDAISARLDPDAIKLSTPAKSIARDPDGWRIDAGGFVRIYDALVVASPAWAAGELLGQVDAELAAELSGIPYSSSITVNLVYDEARLGPLPEGFGFLVPPSEGRAMLACTFVHRKFLGRTPPGKAVFRAFLGGMKNEALLADPDAALIAVVRRELREILGEKVFGQAGDPEHAQVSRWRRAMAQYAVGHKQRMERIAARVAALPNLHLVGNAYDGIGVPDCIRLGRQAARELAAAAAKNPSNSPQISITPSRPAPDSPLPAPRPQDEPIRASAVK
ncbi:MAG TPA: protoporphyrinogen oxidase [Terracidiphilus sp.]|nr:protoporphyrinogen oxidase [Terracidiphilus sp.]